ncbi:MAG: peptidase prolyl oligopeptidase active site domain protein [Chloroflexi bacterium]|nr:peptidase prolyl oligopeptidase active site domain protein [Chloroflexota bacterium]
MRGQSNGLRWSPDGSTLGFLSSEGRVSTDDALFVVPAAGGEARAFMPGYEGSVDWFDWAHDGKSLLVSAVEHEASALLRVAVSGGSSEPILPEQLRGHGYIGEQISYSADRKTLAVVRSSGEQPAEVWTGTAASLRRRTSFNADVEQWATGRVERLSWVGAEGIEISGLLVYPAGYTPGKRYPLVLHIHGGPTWFWSDHFYASWHDWAQYLASHGYAVLLPNPHGSAGRGAAFADSTLDDYGGKELTDDLFGVDQVIAMGVADPDRLGVGGWSHGGYLAAWAISQTDRFKAAVMGAGMSNLISDQGQNDIPRCNDQYFSKRTYEDPDLFMQRSPITYVQNIKTPVLILHGGADERVNPMQGREFYIALRLLGLPCMLVTYPREGHHIEERKHQTDLLRRVLDWYDRYLKGPSRQA